MTNNNKNTREINIPGITIYQPAEIKPDDIISLTVESIGYCPIKNPGISVISKDGDFPAVVVDTNLILGKLNNLKHTIRILGQTIDLCKNEINELEKSIAAINI